jgi:hypothetical protein
LRLDLINDLREVRNLMPNIPVDFSLRRKLTVMQPVEGFVRNDGG